MAGFAPLPPQLSRSRFTDEETTLCLAKMKKLRVINNFRESERGGFCLKWWKLAGTENFAFDGQGFDDVITVGDNARESCPLRSTVPKKNGWRCSDACGMNCGSISARSHGTTAKQNLGIPDKSVDSLAKQSGNGHARRRRVYEPDQDKEAKAQQETGSRPAVDRVAHDGAQAVAPALARSVWTGAEPGLAP